MNTASSHAASHGHSHANTVPRPALVMAGALVALALTMTAAVRLGFVPRDAVPASERTSAGVTPVETRHLAFADRADGAVVITDTDTGALVATLTGEGDGGGFVRGVLRGFARDRRMRGVGSAPPFALTLWHDGAISLTDSATGRSVELGSFGPDNRAAFARYLDGARP